MQHPWGTTWVGRTGISVVGSVDEELAGLVWALSQILETRSNSKEGQQTSRMPKPGFPTTWQNMDCTQIKLKENWHDIPLIFTLKSVLLIHAHFRSLRSSKWFNVWMIPEAFRRYSGSQGTKGNMNKVTFCVLCIHPNNTFVTLTSTLGWI